MAAFNLALGRALGFSDGYIYGMIRVGRGLMPAYGYRVTHFDRWHIVNYVRQLQGPASAAPRRGGRLTWRASTFPTRFRCGTSSGPRSATLVFGAMFVVGLLSFIARLVQDAPSAWASYVSNWMFFTSIAMGALILVVAATITSARWNWSVKRVSISFVAFLPIRVHPLPADARPPGGVLPLDREMATDPILQKKQAWLKRAFPADAQTSSACSCCSVCRCTSRTCTCGPTWASRPTRATTTRPRARWRERLMNGWLGQESEEVASHQRLARLAPGMVLVYAAVMSMLAYDWAMSLEPHWYSTLFGVWFFMGAFWGGVRGHRGPRPSGYARKHADFAEAMGSQQRHDLGKLAFAFCVFWTYLFWSQYLVIWYGKAALGAGLDGAPRGGAVGCAIGARDPSLLRGSLRRAHRPAAQAAAAVFGDVLQRPSWSGSGSRCTCGSRPRSTRPGRPSRSSTRSSRCSSSARSCGRCDGRGRRFPVIQVWQPLVESEMLEAERQMEVEAGAAAD